MSDHLPDPATAPELFDGVLSRRVLAWLVDTVIIFGISLAMLVVGLIIGVVTLGVGLITLPFIIPFAILAYYAATLGSPSALDRGHAHVRPGADPGPRQAARWLGHPDPPPSSSGPRSGSPGSASCSPLFTPRRQMLHDLVTGTLMLRRSPMERVLALRRHAFAPERCRAAGIGHCRASRTRLS